MNIYKKYKAIGFDNKYVDPDKLLDYIQQRNWNYQLLGYSQAGRSIYSVSLGHGDVSLAFWSQMHGNESTATRAMLDFFNYLEKNEYLLEQYTIDWIPQLNPDGAKVWDRLSYTGIDLNRDFIQSSSPEMKLLKSFIFSKSYRCIFNLHDQRNLFYTNNNKQPSNIALLSPVTGQINEPVNYFQSIDYLNEIIVKLQMYTTVNLAKFNNNFYPLATGDNFQLAGIPTILVEAGYTLNDHQRNITREQLFYLFISALEIDYFKPQQSVNAYQHLPENCEGAFDLIISNVALPTHKDLVITDLGLRYRDILKSNKIYPKIVIEEIGDLSSKLAYQSYDAANRVYNNLDNKLALPKRGEIGHFMLGEEVFIENGEIKTTI